MDKSNFRFADFSKAKRPGLIAGGLGFDGLFEVGSGATTGRGMGIGCTGRGSGGINGGGGGTAADGTIGGSGGTDGTSIGFTAAQMRQMSSKGDSLAEQEAQIRAMLFPP